MNRRAGVSLVELLVVLGVIAIMTAVAVPTARLYFNRPGNDLGARSFFTIMKASAVYASTYNVPTAVVLNVREFTDSQTGNPAPAMTEYMLARQLKPAELTALRNNLSASGIAMPGSAPGVGPLFVPLSSDAGALREFEGKAALLGEFFTTYVHDAEDAQGNIAPVIDLMSTTGMSRIRLVINLDEPEVVEVSAQSSFTPPLSDALAGHMPAYLFKTDGALLVADTFAPQRVVVRMGIRPDQPLDERFLMNSDTGVIETDAAGNPILISTALEIFHATGRMRIVP